MPFAHALHSAGGYLPAPTIPSLPSFDGLRTAMGAATTHENVLELHATAAANAPVLGLRAAVGALNFLSLGGSGARGGAA